MPGWCELIIHEGPVGRNLYSPQFSPSLAAGPLLWRCTSSILTQETLVLSSRLSRWLSSKESICQFRRCRFDPRVGKIPWRRKWQPTPIFLPGKSHGQRSLKGYSPWDHRVWQDWATGHTHSLLNVSLHGQTHPGFDKGLPAKPCMSPIGSSLLGHLLEDLLQSEMILVSSQEPMRSISCLGSVEVCSLQIPARNVKIFTFFSPSHWYSREVWAANSGEPQKCQTQVGTCRGLAIYLNEG